jgi:hypothetical protein
MVFITTKKGEILIFDFIKFEFIKEIFSDMFSINCICLSQDEDFFVIGGDLLKIFKISTFENILTYKANSKILHCHFVSSFIYYSDFNGFVFRRTLL